MAQGPVPHRYGSESLLPARPLSHGAFHLLEPPTQYVHSPRLLNPERGPENASLFIHMGDQVSEGEGLTPRTVQTRDPSPLPSPLPSPSPIPPLTAEGSSLCTSCPRRGRKNGAMGFVGGGQPEGPAGTTPVPRGLPLTEDSVTGPCVLPSPVGMTTRPHGGQGGQLWPSHPSQHTVTETPAIY